MRCQVRAKAGARTLAFQKLLAAFAVVGLFGAQLRGHEGKGQRGFAGRAQHARKFAIHAGIGFVLPAKDDVDRNGAWLAACHVADYFGPHGAGPGPPSQFFL